MRKLIVTAVAATFLGLGGAALAQVAASPCKGVAEDACKANAACAWRNAYVAGETVLKTE